MVNDDGGEQSSELLAGVKQLLENAVGPINALALWQCVSSSPQRRSLLT